MARKKRAASYLNVDASNAGFEYIHKVWLQTFYEEGNTFVFQPQGNTQYLLVRNLNVKITSVNKKTGSL